MSTTAYDKKAPPAARVPAPPPGKRRRRLGPGRPVPYGWAVGPLLLALWAAGSALGLVDARSLPAPWTVAGTAGDLIADGRLQSNPATSAQRALWGLLFGVVAGLLLALVSGLSRLGEAVIDGPVQIKWAIPSLALIPLLILWLGIGETMKVVTIALGVFVPVYIHTHNGLRGIDHRYAEPSAGPRSPRSAPEPSTPTRTGHRCTTRPRTPTNRAATTPTRAPRRPCCRRSSARAPHRSPDQPHRTRGDPDVHRLEAALGRERRGARPLRHPHQLGGRGGHRAGQAGGPLRAGARGGFFGPR
jgi:hypothetical protein